VVHHVIPFPRQVESISEYSDAEKDVLLGLKSDIYKGLRLEEEYSMMQSNSLFNKIVSTLF
jgi:hypothetical protein